MARKPGTPKQVDALRHGDASRRNIPTAELQSFFLREEDTHPLPPKHYRRIEAHGDSRSLRLISLDWEKEGIVEALHLPAP